jgi:hypothetical protein
MVFCLQANSGWILWYCSIYVLTQDRAGWEQRIIPASPTCCQGSPLLIAATASIAQPGERKTSQMRGHAILHIDGIQCFEMTTLCTLPDPSAHPFLRRSAVPILYCRHQKGIALDRQLTPAPQICLHCHFHRDIPLPRSHRPQSYCPRQQGRSRLEGAALYLSFVGNAVLLCLLAEWTADKVDAIALDRSMQTTTRWGGA